MNLIEIAKSINWQDPSKFKVMILPTGSVSSNLINITPEILTASINNIRLADINTAPIEEWIGEEWRFATGRLENYQVEITMKDFDNFKLYRMWANAKQKFVRAYPDDQKFDIKIQTASDYQITNYIDMVTFKDCMLITVNSPTLDNSANASVAEFSIVAKSSYVKI